MYTDKGTEKLLFCQSDIISFILYDFGSDFYVIICEKHATTCVCLDSCVCCVFYFFLPSCRLFFGSIRSESLKNNSTCSTVLESLSDLLGSSTDQLIKIVL